MFEKLKARWKLESTFQVIVVLVVFACTGFTIYFLKKPIVGLISSSEEYNTIYTILYYVFILPVYNVVLLIYGFIFGQFKFFWAFEKRMWNRMTGKKSNDPEQDRSN